MTPGERMETFWATDCGARGPALPHTHGDCQDPERRTHHLCPCIECGLTPERWLALVTPNIRMIPPEADIAMREAGIVDPDDLPLELPQPGELGVPIMERRATTRGTRDNRYVQWEPMLGSYVSGDPNGPGRGPLSPAWVAWATTAHWRS